METKSWIELIFSFVITVSTVIYAIITWKLFKESASQRIALTEPLLNLRLQSNEESKNIIELYFENIGNGIAYDIKFDFMKDFIYTNQNNKKLSSIAFFKNGLIALAPRQNYKIVLTSLLNDQLNGVKHDPIIIKVTYNTPSQKNKETIFTLNFDELIGLLYVDNNNNEREELINAIQELTKTLKEKNKHNR